jgi:hypothetical protein
MSQFDDHQKHSPPDSIAPSPLFKWVASILGSLVVLLVFDLYASNRKALESLNQELIKVREQQARTHERIRYIERLIDGHPPPHQKN